jgi:hypothetical protein
VNWAGVWQRLHELLLAELHSAGKLGWSRAVIDSSHVRAARRGHRETGGPTVPLVGPAAGGAILTVAFSHNPCMTAIGRCSAFTGPPPACPSG